MNLLYTELLRRYNITKIVMICNHANKMLVILQIMSSVFKFQNYRIQFFVICILSLFCFFKLIIYKRNEMLLIIAAFLIKHVFDVVIKHIDFHLQCNILIVML